MEGKNNQQSNNNPMDMEQMAQYLASLDGEQMKILNQKKKEIKTSSANAEKEEIKLKYTKEVEKEIKGKPQKEIRSMLINLMVEEKIRKARNEKKSATSKKSTAPRCQACKCVSNREQLKASNGRYKNIAGHKWNELKLCNKKLKKGEKYCPEHMEKYNQNNQYLPDGEWNKPHHFKTHTTPSQREWVNMIYDLNEWARPKEEVKEEVQEEVVENEEENEEEESEEEYEEELEEDTEQ